MEAMEPIDLKNVAPKNVDVKLPALEKGEDEIMQALEGLDVK